MEQSSSFTKPFRNDGDALVIDNEIANLKRVFLKNYDIAFVELLNAMTRNSNHKEFYKLKEFFLTHCDNLQELPKMNDEGIDKFIEAILLVCQKWPTPLTSKGFRVFHKFFLNKQGYKNNEFVKRRFKFTKLNLSRLGLEHYLDDKENVSCAMEISLSYLLENEHSCCKQLFETDKNVDFVIWWDRRNHYKITGEIFKQIEEAKANIMSFENMKNEMRNEVTKNITELKNNIEFVNGDLHELKGSLLEIKEQVRVIRSEYAKYSDLTDWKKDMEKCIDRRIYDLTEIVRSEYCTKSVFRNLEFLVKKQKEDHDVESNLIKQDIQGRLKLLQEDLNQRMDIKEERTSKIETELRNMFRESDEKLLQLQIYTKSYSEKMTENDNILSQVLDKLSSEIQTNINQLEGESLKNEKRFSEINEKLHQTTNKSEMESFSRKTDTLLSKHKHEITLIGENQENHLKSLETIYKVMSDNKQFLELKFLLVDEVVNKMVTQNFEIENILTEVRWLKDKADFLGNNLTDTNNTISKLNKKIEQIQDEYKQSYFQLNEKAEDLNQKTKFELTSQILEIKEEITLEINRAQQNTLSLINSLQNIKTELVNVQGTLTSVQTEFNFYNQSLSNTQINLGNLGTKIDTVYKNLEKQMQIEQELMSSRLIDVSNQINNLKEKVKDSENILNPFPRKIFSLEVRIEEITRYFGLKFSRTDELEPILQENLSSINLTDENKKLLAPYISSLIIDFKNISNKIPYYQKRVGHLQKLFSEFEIDKDTKEQLNVGKMESQGVNQEPVLKSPSKLVQLSTSENTVNAILTAEDVNTNLLIIRTELMTENEKMFSCLLQGQKAIENAQKDLLEKVIEVEQKINSGGVSFDIQNLKNNVQVWQDNFDKFKQTMRNDVSEINKYFNKTQNVHNEKLQSLENELRNVKKQLFTTTLAAGISATTTNMGFNEKKQEASLKSILKRIDLLELIADDYLELHLEKEVVKCQQKLTNKTFNFEEKTAAYCYILQHYRLLNSNFMIDSFRRFMDLLDSNKNNPQIKSLKQEYFPSLYSLIKNPYDCHFPNFQIFLESILFFLTGSENINKALDHKSLSILVEHLENTSRIEVLTGITKLMASLSQYDQILNILENKELFQQIWEVFQSIINKFLIILNTHLVSEEKHLNNLITQDDVSSNMNTGLLREELNSSDHPNRYIEDKNTIADFILLKYQMSSELSGVLDQENEKWLKVLQYEELVYYCLFLFYNAVQKGGLSKLRDNVKTFNQLIKISGEKKISYQLTEITFLCIYLITERIHIKYEQIENIQLLNDLGNLAMSPKTQPEIQDLLNEILRNLCQDGRIKEYLIKTIDIEKIGGKEIDFEIKQKNNNLLKYFQLLPNYESSNMLSQITTNFQIENYLIKKQERIITLNETSDLMKSRPGENQSKNPPEVKASKPKLDSVGRRVSTKGNGTLPTSHDVNKTFDASIPINSKNSNRKISTRDDSFDSLQGKRDKTKTKKPTSANIQLPSLNGSAGRRLFKNQ